MEASRHWSELYATKSDEEVSWHEPDPTVSLRMIDAAVGGLPSPRIIDVGGGTSRLVDNLLDRSFATVMVMDFAATALEKAQERLGARKERVQWLVADVTKVQDLGTFDIWHDRAVYHFLISSADRAHYVDLARRSVPRGGHVILGTFALDGPQRCSGLPVNRYDASGLAAEFVPWFAPVSQRLHEHMTPQGRRQPFLFVDLVRT